MIKRARYTWQMHMIVVAIRINIMSSYVQTLRHISSSAIMAQNIVLALMIALERAEKMQVTNLRAD